MNEDSVGHPRSTLRFKEADKPTMIFASRDMVHINTEEASPGFNISEYKKAIMKKINLSKSREIGVLAKIESNDTS